MASDRYTNSWAWLHDGQFVSLVARPFPTIGVCDRRHAFSTRDFKPVQRTREGYDGVMLYVIAHFKNHPSPITGANMGDQRILGVLSDSQPPNVIRWSLTPITTPLCRSTPQIILESQPHPCRLLANGINYWPEEVLKAA